MASAVVKSSNPSFASNPWIVAQSKKKKKFTLGSKDAEVPVYEQADNHAPTRSYSVMTSNNNNSNISNNSNNKYSRMNASTIKYPQRQTIDRGRITSNNNSSNNNTNNSNSSIKSPSGSSTSTEDSDKENTNIGGGTSSQRRQKKMEIIAKQREKQEKHSTKDVGNKFVYTSVPKPSHSTKEKQQNSNKNNKNSNSKNKNERGRNKNGNDKNNDFNRYSTNPRMHSPLRGGLTPTAVSVSESNEYKSDSESNISISTNTPTPTGGNGGGGAAGGGHRGRTRSKSFKLGQNTPSFPNTPSNHDTIPSMEELTPTANDNSHGNTNNNNMSHNSNNENYRSKNRNKGNNSSTINRIKTNDTNNSNNNDDEISKVKTDSGSPMSPKKHVLSSLSMEEYTDLQKAKNMEKKSMTKSKGAGARWPPKKNNGNHSTSNSSNRTANNTSKQNHSNNNNNNDDNSGSNEKDKKEETKEDEFKYQLTRPMGFSQYQNQFRKHNSGKNVLPSDDSKRNTISMAAIKANPFTIQGMDNQGNAKANTSATYQMDNKVGRMSNKEINAAFRKPIKSLESIKLPKYNGEIPRVLIELKRRLHDCGGIKQKMIFHVAVKSTQQHHVIATLIRSWFSELPQPLLSVVEPSVIDQARTIQLLPDVVKQIPEPNQSVLLWLWDLLADVVEATQLNRMTSQTLAQAFGPIMTKIDDKQLQKQKRATFQALFASRVIVFTKRGIEWRLSLRQ